MKKTIILLFCIQFSIHSISQMSETKKHLDNTTLETQNPFSIGTEWTYELVTPFFTNLVEKEPITFSIVDTVTIKGINAFVIDPSSYGPMEYMYYEDNSMFLFDHGLDTFVKVIDINEGIETYEVPWFGLCFNNLGSHHVTFDSSFNSIVDGVDVEKRH